MSHRRRVLWSLPWVIAPICLAVPLIGGGFAGWPFVVGWLVLMVVTWWVRPLGGAGRTGRLAVGVLMVALLALLGTLGGFFLIPAVLVWLALVATEPPRATPDGQPLSEQGPPRAATLDTPGRRNRTCGGRVDGERRDHRPAWWRMMDPTDNDGGSGS